MKTHNTSTIDEQSGSEPTEQPTANTNEKPSAGLKIRSRVGMMVRSNLQGGCDSHGAVTGHCTQ